jgi:hypothetical protein
LSAFFRPELKSELKHLTSKLESLKVLIQYLHWFKAFMSWIPENASGRGIINKERSAKGTVKV